jgi:serine/threonine protein kinase
LRCHFQQKSGRAVTGYDGQKADMWSCGVVLFVFMFGQTPWDFARESSQEYRLYKHTEGYPCIAPWEGMNRTIRALFHGLLAVHPGRRWSSQDLRAFLSRELGWKYHAFPSQVVQTSNLGGPGVGHV